MAYGFKGLGWFLCGMIVAPACYLMTSQVAAERAELARADREIVDTQRNIRALEIEFAARANIDEVQRWNETGVRMVAASPDQYLPDVAALAAYDPSSEPQPQFASLLVPAGGPRIETAPQPAAAPSKSVAATAPAPARAPEAAEAPRADPALARAVRMADARPVDRVAVQRVAMLDDSLLSAATRAKIQERMLVERTGLR